MTLEGNHVAVLDAEHVELVVVKETKKNPQKWMNNCESQVGELDQLKLKTAVLYGDRDKEVYMTQLAGFIAAKSV